MPDEQQYWFSLLGPLPCSLGGGRALQSHLNPLNPSAMSQVPTQDHLYYLCNKAFLPNCQSNRFLQPLSRVFALLAWQQHSAFARFTHRTSGRLESLKNVLGKSILIQFQCPVMLFPSVSPKEATSFIAFVAFLRTWLFVSHLECMVNTKISWVPPQTFGIRISGIRV